MRVAPQRLLDAQGQRVHAAAHVRVTGRATPERLMVPGSSPRQSLDHVSQRRPVDRPIHDDPSAVDQHDLHRARWGGGTGVEAASTLVLITAGTNRVGSSADTGTTGPITRRHENSRFALRS
jgi:hypothetical protein